MGYRITAPPGITISNVVLRHSQLQNIADGHGWIGLTYWNGGTAQVLPPGTAVDAAASGPLNTPYWGIELRCVQSVCAWPERSSSTESTCMRARRRGRASRPLRTRAAYGTRPDRLDLERAGDAWPLPVDRSGCVGSMQPERSGWERARRSPTPSLPAPNNSSWQECQSGELDSGAGHSRLRRAGRGSYPSRSQATNAAALPNPPMSETLNVDNDTSQRLTYHTRTTRTRRYGSTTR